MIEIQAPDGSIAQFPDGTSDATIEAAMAKAFPKPLTAGQTAARSAEFLGRGFVDSAAETLGAIPDLGTKAMRAVGLTEQAPDYYTRKIKEGINATLKAIPHPTVAGPQTPTGTIERGAYGAGRGVADAASIALPAMGAAKIAKGGTVAQGVAKTLAAQPALQATASGVGGAVTEATDNPWLGLAASVATPMVVGGARRLVTPKSNATGEASRLADVMKKEGVPVRASQLTSSRAIRNLDAAAGELPISGGMKTADIAAQKEAFNQAVLRKAGINAKSATPEVLRGAYDDFGERFTALANRTNVPVTDTLRAKLDDIFTKYGSKLEAGRRGILKSYIDDIKKLNSLSGDGYKVNRSDIGTAAFKYAKSDYKLSEAMHNLTKTLDDAVEGGLPNEDLKRSWQTLRRQYSNYATIRDAMESGAEEALDGNIPASRLLNAVKKSTLGGYVRGKGDLNDLARAGKKFIPDKVPNSGTAQRALASAALVGPAALAGYIANSPELALASAATPAGVYKALNNPVAAKYFSNQALPYAKQMTPGLLSSVGLARLKNDLLSQGLLD